MDFLKRGGGEMNKKWVLPAEVLILLLGAWYFRWDYRATKTVDAGIYKWKVDRWTGQGWVERYTTGNGWYRSSFKTYAIEPFTSKRPYYYRNLATRIWQGAVLIAILWLFISLRTNNQLKDYSSPQLKNRSLE